RAISRRTCAVSRAHPMRRRWRRSARTELIRGAGCVPETAWGEAAMPNDVKAIVSVLSLIVAAILAYLSGSPVRPEFPTYIILTGVLRGVAMWVFPEAGVKKGDVKKSNR